MNETQIRFIGIDPFAKEGSFTYSILDEECQMIVIDESDITSIQSIIPLKRQVYVAVNGPRRPNLGLVKKELSNLELLPGQKRGNDLRMAEKLIRDMGINIYATPSKEELCPEWMHLSFLIFDELTRLGFSPFPTIMNDWQWMETHASTIFLSTKSKSLQD